MSTDKPPTELQRGIARLKRNADAAQAAEIVQLPLWPEPRRGTPNSFLRSALFSAIQSRDRVFVKGARLASQEGITIEFTGEQLNQEDLTLWETLVHLAREHPLGHVCTFTAHGLLKAMNMHTGGDEHRRLHAGILRLIACAVEITHNGRRYAGSLVESSVDDLSDHYEITLNKSLARLFGESHWSAVDWHQRLQLRRKPLAQYLHAYYSTHREPFPVKLATLQRFSGSRIAQPAGFKRLCTQALDELVSIGFLLSYSIDDDSVLVRRTPPPELPQG